jgi:hypothetical protein
MASSLIAALTVTTPHSPAVPVPVTDGERNGLLDALAKVPTRVTRAGSVTRCRRSSRSRSAR